MHKKFWSRARLEPTSFCLADLKKSYLINLYAKCQKLRLARPQIQTMRFAVLNERVVARKKKHPHFPITLAYRKCNKMINRKRASRKQMFENDKNVTTSSRDTQLIIALAIIANIIDFGLLQLPIVKSFAIITNIRVSNSIKNT